MYQSPTIVVTRWLCQDVITNSGSADVIDLDGTGGVLDTLWKTNG